MCPRSSLQKSKENFVSALSVGVFLVLLGAIFVSTPDFFGKIVDFFTDITIVRVPHFGVISLPMPEHLIRHTVVYSAAAQFCFAWGVFLVGLLVVRIFAGSPFQKKVENVSDIVFWLLSGVLILHFLNVESSAVITAETWFGFWAALITVLGVSLIVRAIILALFK